MVESFEKLQGKVKHVNTMYAQYTHALTLQLQAAEKILEVSDKLLDLDALIENAGGEGFYELLSLDISKPVREKTYL